MQTFVLQCGQVLSFCELLRGESLQLVYAMLLRLTGKLIASGHEPQAVFYDNACKLLAMARSKRACFPPLTENFADMVILLDQLHRDNHEWCLTHLPEVDCRRPEVSRYTVGVDTQACEQFNDFVNDLTPPAREMTAGRYWVYWSAIFRLKNNWQLRQRGDLRQRYARGYMKQNPDVPRQRPRKNEAL